MALVTGASKGVGRGIAVGLAQAGWDVVVNYAGDRSGAEETAARVAHEKATIANGARGSAPIATPSGLTYRAAYDARRPLLVDDRFDAVVL